MMMQVKSSLGAPIQLEIQASFSIWHVEYPKECQQMYQWCPIGARN